MIFVYFVLIVTASVYCYFIRTFHVWSSKNVRGPKPIPFFGNIKENVLRRQNAGSFLKEIYDDYPDEKVVGIYRMMSPTLLIRDLDIVKQILIKDFEVFSDRGIAFSKEGLGDNLFHCDKSVWHPVRGHLSPLFSSGKIKATLPHLNDQADRLVKYLEDTISDVACEGNEQELIQHFRKYTMATIMSALYSINIDFFKENCEAIMKVGDHIFASTYASEMDMLFPNVLRDWNVSLYSYLVNKFCYDVVFTHSEQTKGVSELKNSVMDILQALDTGIKAKKMNETDNNTKQCTLDVTEHLKAAQVFIFFAAGFGNNSLSMSYAMFRLAKNTDVQERLIREIDDVLERYDGEISNDALKEMVYLGKVFCEVLRMNSLTQAILRSAKKDYTIPGTEMTIDKGTSIIISLYAIHRDESLYPDPDQFDPERFSAENSAGRHPCAYIPFGDGPRSCIGRQFAKLQFMVGIVKILRKFRLEPSDRTKIIEDYDPMSTLMPTKGGVYVKLIRRK